jgi:DNA-binding beta-propeller fold protein YncE
MKSILKCLLTAFLLLAVAPALFAAGDPNFQVTAHFATAGEGGWDYLTFDAEGRRLFITRATHVQVLDTATGKLLGDIPNTSGAHGVALASDLGIGAISNGKAGSVSLFNLKSLEKTADVKAGTKPDAILYDAASHLVFAFNGVSHDVTVIDPAKAAAVATIPLPGQPEFGATDLQGHVFVNLEDKSEIAEIDVQHKTVLAHWPLTGCDGPTGLAIDRAHNRLFSVCANQVMTVLDPASGKVVATVPIGKHPDAAAFDSALGLAFSSNGDGTLTVVHQESPDSYKVLQNVPTASGARTLALDPGSHTVYLVTAKFGPAPAATAADAHARPTMIPGSFEVLVVGTK